MNYNDLALFAEVIQAGSLTAAADRTGMPLSTISRRLNALEASLETRLINRTTRRLDLTDAGKALLRHSQEIINQGYEAQQALQALSDEPEGDLHVGIPFAVDIPWGSDTMGSFLRLFPHINLHMQVVERVADMDGLELDVMLCFGDKPMTHHRVLDFGSNAMMLCASPEYQRRHGLPNNPEQLSEHTMVVYSDFAWQEHCAEPFRHIHPSYRMTTSEPLLARQAVVDGIGIGFFPEIMLRPSMVKGDLMALLPQCNVEKNLWVVVSRNKEATRKINVFLQHMLQKAAESAPWNYPVD